MQWRTNSKKAGKNLRVVAKGCSGIIINHFVYFIISYHSEWKQHEALISATIGLVVAVAMALSDKVCSVVFLAVPSFCTAKGRLVLFDLYAI